MTLPLLRCNLKHKISIWKRYALEATRKRYALSAVVEDDLSQEQGLIASVLPQSSMPNPNFGKLYALGIRLCEMI